jgi:D-glycero-beta-D-manno-heptose-7-phosphate kinase
MWKSFESVRVLIIGDVMIDRYLHGHVRRISPEAPVPVVEWSKTEDRLGGAGNVALNIKALGATPYLCSVIGKEAAGTALISLMLQNNLSTKGLIAVEQRKTTVKTRIIAGSQQMLRIDEESLNDLNETEQHDLLLQIRAVLDTKKIDVILFQDYNKGVLTLNLIQMVLKEAVRRGIPTCVDPKHRHFLEYKQSTLFKPNLKEIREALPLKIEPNLVSLSAAADYLHRVMENRYTMITLSEKGLFIYDGKQGHLVPTRPRRIADVSGAGDTVIAMASVALAIGMDLKTIAAWCNLAGGIVCESPGVVPIDKERLIAEWADEMKH